MLLYLDIAETLEGWPFAGFAWEVCMHLIHESGLPCTSMSGSQDQPPVLYAHHHNVRIMGKKYKCIYTHKTVRLNLKGKICYGILYKFHSLFKEKNASSKGKTML